MGSNTIHATFKQVNKKMFFFLIFVAAPDQNQIKKNSLTSSKLPVFPQRNIYEFCYGKPEC